LFAGGEKRLKRLVETSLNVWQGFLAKFPGFGPSLADTYTLGAFLQLSALTVPQKVTNFDLFLPEIL